ncbi:MAG: dienelactone hydrolase family protein [Nocardioides sp.]|jgi:dienelactone hydrolase
MSALDGWVSGEHTAHVNGRPRTFPTYRRGTGPGVIVIHEMPGLTEGVIGFGQEVVDAGFTVVLPHLFGAAGKPWAAADTLRIFPGICVSREFTKLATGVTTPMAGWLQSLARSLHAELGGPGVGALGMCFTGGFALAMMLDESTVAPVLCQPSVPFFGSQARNADLNLSAADASTVRERARAGCEVLGLRYRSDKMTGTRFDTLTDLIGDRFLRVEFEGEGHSTVTEQRQQEGVDRVLRFFEEKLRG